MKGKIVQFRRGRHVIKERHYLIEIPKILNRKSTEKYIGKEVIWTSPGKNKRLIKGKISAPHGNKGLVRAIFERGLPGQAITDGVEIKE
jgi:large subunit ribosomal protein L35Ae